MADINVQILDLMKKQQETLERIEASLSGGAAGANNTGRINLQEKDVKKLTERISELAKQVGEEVNAEKLLLKQVEQQRLAILQSNRTLKEQKEALDALNTSLEKTIDETEDLTEVQKASSKAIIESTKATAAKKIADIEGKEAVDKFNKGISQVQNTFAPLSKAFGSIISSYQSGGSQIGLASGIMQAELGLASSSATSAGGSLMSAGAAAAQSGTKLGKFGGIALTAAGGLSLFAGKMGEVAQKVLPVLTTELNKYIKSFQSMSTSGALFTDGITGMANAGKDLGLTLEQTSEFAKRNGESAALMGLGVTGAMKELGKVSKVIKDSGVQNQLLNLGFTIEEQADLIAETSSTMKRFGANVSDKEVAAQTKSYAENLRTIAAITGEDAKKKVAQVKAENDYLAFTQAKAKMSPKQQAQIDAAMATMTAQERKNFQDRIAFNGQVVNKEGLMYESMIDGTREKGLRQLELLEQGNLTAQSNADLNKEFGKRISESALNADALGKGAIVIGGALTGVATAAQDAIKQQQIYTGAAVDAAKTNIAGQENTQDDVTKSMNKVIIANQEAALAIQNAILNSGVMTLFADEVTKATKALTGLINKFGGGEGGGGGGGWMGALTTGLTALDLGLQGLNLFKGGGSKGGGGPHGPEPHGGGPKPKGRLSRFFGGAVNMGREAISAGAGIVGSLREKAGGVAAGLAGAGGVISEKVGGAVGGAANAAKGVFGGAEAKAAEKLAGKEAAEIGAKALGKTILKKIPGVSIIAGLGFGLQRALSGDFLGAAGEVASGVASTFPGVGTAASIAIDAGLAARDAGLIGGGNAVPATPAEPGGAGTPQALDTSDADKAKAAAVAAAEAEKTKPVTTEAVKTANASDQLMEIMSKLNNSLDELNDHMSRVAVNTKLTYQALG